MGLLSKLGGAAKEGLRKGAVNGLLNATGNSAATGKINYQNNVDDISDRYGTMSDYGDTTDIFQGNFGGLNARAGNPRPTSVGKTITDYPGKYKYLDPSIYQKAYDETYNNDERVKKYNQDYQDQTNQANAFADAFGGAIDNNTRNAIVSTNQQNVNQKHKTNLSAAKNNADETANLIAQRPDGLIEASSIHEAEQNYKQNNFKTKLNINSDFYKFKLPDWNYADFINERAIWQKGLSSILDEPAWFYFKIFFDFDTEHGLFGGLLNDAYLHSATNSAAKYLYSVRNLHKHAKPKDRINALYKFASILSYINTSAPWYFKSVKGLNKAVIPIVDDFTKEKSIEIETMPDAIDMRLSTLMSLYYYACFDSLMDKEIIPENLRKFNMTIILFQSPLRYFHTSYMTHKKMEFMGINTDALGLGGLMNKKSGGNGIVKYKSMSPNGSGSTGDFANTMSMQVITLYACEFDKEAFSSMIPNEATNETPFQLGKNTIKINYTSSTLHTMNEFYAMMFGSDGFYFNQYSNFQTADGDWNGYKNRMNNVWAKQKERYNTLSETFNNLASGGSILGIIDAPKSYKSAIDATEAIMNGIGEDKNMLTSLGVNFALGLLGSSQNMDAPQGNIYGDYGLGSAYYKDKLEMLKNGVHERTQAPYYYDPYTGAKIDLHKSKTYTAYNFKNDISSIKQFDLGNWVNNKVTDFGNKLNNGLRDFFGGKSDFVQNPYLSNNGQIANKDYQVNEPGVVNAGEKGKTQVMVDNPKDWRNVEKPYDYKPKDAVNNENNKAGGQYKVQDMVDETGNPIHQVTEKPFNYDPQNAIKYENSKAGGQYKVQDMVDETGNPIHQVTEKPFEYKPEDAVKYETGKSGGQYKSTDMVDDPTTWTRTEKPFNYDPKEAVNYENSKAGDFYKVQDMVDNIGNPEHQVTEKPFNYDPKEAVNYENSKAGGQYKVQDMVDGIGNAEHEVTEKPFNYDPKEAVNYENSKAGGQYKVQDMVDGIGNPIHEVTEAPFNYDPKEAVNYENSKAGGQYKVQDMVDGIGNAEHEVTEAPFVYSAKEAVNYENSKAGGHYKVQDMVDGIGNAEHEVTEAPFNYDPKSAIEYENSKAGGQYKVQDMVDGIGNAEHEVTEAPFNYDPKSAIEYENSKAGGHYKVQDMVDGIGNAEHEVTEAPFNYDPKSAIEYENSKAGGQYKVQDMVDGIGNAEHEVTEAPFNYDPKSAIEYENSKAGGQYKVQDMVDGIGNAEHEVTEAPFNYDPKSAIEYENSKAGGQYKVQDMVDGIGNAEHEVTEAPFNYDPKSAIEYENSKAGGQYKVQDMTDGIGNAEHEVTEAPFNYDPKSAIEYENSKAGGQYKVQDMVDGIGNAEHEVTEAPFNYDPKSAIEYENSKAGGQYKVQDMTDGIGNAEHEVTEAPFNYDPKSAIEYENSKAGGQYKVQDMVDGIGNAEHEVTEAPFNYDPKSAIEYENSKAGGQYKVQDMTDGIGNAEHEVTEAPFNYNHKEAINYENSKAGGQYKVQDMTDGIGNAEHEVTEAPFNYNPKEAIKYEQSKKK